MPEVLEGMRTSTGGVDAQGVAYTDYPRCPTCPGGGRVGRNAFAEGDYAASQAAAGYLVAPWYCYECCITFH